MAYFQNGGFFLKKNSGNFELLMSVTLIFILVKKRSIIDN